MTKVRIPKSKTCSSCIVITVSLMNMSFNTVRVLKVFQGILALVLTPFELYNCNLLQIILNFTHRKAYSLFRVHLQDEGNLKVLHLIIKNIFRFEDDYEDSLQNIINNNAGVGDSADPSTFAYPQPYCGYINRMPTACFEER